MRVRLVLLFALFPYAYGLAQQTAPQPGFPGGGLWQHPPDRMVPIEVADGVITAVGAVSGGGGKSTGPLAFVVDTAATATILDSTLARGLGWTPASGPYQSRTLELAGASVGNRPMFGMNLSPLARQVGTPVDGIAGSDIFQHFAVRVDYVQHGLTLTLPESCATPEKKLRLRVLGGLPFVEASVGAPGGTMILGMFLVDTGQAGTGLILTSEFLQKHPELGQKQVHLPSFDSTGKVQPTAFLRLGGIQLGDAALKDVVATVAPPAEGDSGLAGVIAGGVLSRFDLLVDLPRQWLTLTPNADYGQPFEADMSGMLLRSEEPRLRSGEDVRSGDARPAEDRGRRGDRTYTVAAIAEKSPASEAGLQTGDRVVSLGEHKVAEMSMDQVRGILKSTPGTQVVVGIDRAGKGLQVTLTLRRAV